MTHNAWCHVSWCHCSYSQWWESRVWRCLPCAADEQLKGASGELTLLLTHGDDERVDQFNDYYQPTTLTNLAELYSRIMVQSIRYVSLRPPLPLPALPADDAHQPGRALQQNHGALHQVHTLPPLLPRT